MDVTGKYGKTNTVANICKAHGVPLEHGFIVADMVIHGRGIGGYWFDQAEEYLGETLRPQVRADDFMRDLGDLGRWMREQWALTGK